MEDSEEALKKLKLAKMVWIEQGSWRKKRKSEKQEKIRKEIDELFEETLGGLIKLKIADLEKFEKLYWETYVICERDNIYLNTCAGIIASIALVVSSMSLVFTGFESVKGGGITEKIISVLIVSMVIGVIIFTAKEYMKYLAETRERSYYHFLLKAIEEMRNGDLMERFHGICQEK